MKKMSTKSLILHINAHQGYFRHLDEEYSEKNHILFSSITQTFLPLLNMFANLEADGIPFKVCMTFSPILCTLLSDPVTQQSYIEWLDNLISFGECELDRLDDKSKTYSLAQKYLQQLKYTKRDFTETLNQDILSKISYYAKRGNIELLATTATNCFLPHYIDTPEAINAQIEVGIQSHKNFFDVVSEGFWLPHMGYAKGIENLLRAYGLRYTILDSHGLLFASPVPEAGIFSPVRCNNSLILFARDNETPQDITNPNGYMNNPVYRDRNKDIGYEADSTYLSKFLENGKARFSTGFKYWSYSKNADGTSSIYNPEAANRQVELDATNFLDVKAKKLAQASELLRDKDVSLVCTFDANLFGQNWYEGIDWLEQIFRQAAVRTDISLDVCESLTTNQFSIQKIVPYMSSDAGTGYGENLLDSSNCWMMRYTHKACERMIDLSSRFTDDTGLKARSLNLAAKEVLLAQSSDWAQMLHDRNYPEYASDQFTKFILSFSTVFDSLGSNCISTEWLTKLEREHTIFPWINYHVFSPKK